MNCGVASVEGGEAAVVREASPLCFPEKAAQTGKVRLHGRRLRRPEAASSRLTQYVVDGS
jgi:hypothetical protein